MKTSLTSFFIFLIFTLIVQIDQSNCSEGSEENIQPNLELQSSIDGAGTKSASSGRHLSRRKRKSKSNPYEKSKKSNPNSKQAILSRKEEKKRDRERITILKNRVSSSP